jgi:hypothetical protein
VTLRLYSDSNNYHPGEITPSVEMFFNYLSIDGEFLPIAGVFRAEYNFWSKELHTLEVAEVGLYANFFYFHRRIN